MRALRGILAALVLLAITVGVPVALVVVSGNPMPTPAQWDGIVNFRPDYGNEMLFGTILPVAAWALWASFALPILVEVGAQLRGIGTPSLKGLGLQQGAAAALVGAVALMLSAGAVPATAATHAGPVPAAPATTISAALAAEAPAKAQAPVKAQAAEKSHLTVAGDNLWSLAERFLGDGERFGEIAALNHDVLGDNPGMLPIGVKLMLPADAVMALAPAELGHVVMDGQTLSGIAEAHGVTVEQLVAANQGKPQADGSSLQNADEINAGWVLDIPGAAAAAVVPDTAPAPRPAPPKPAVETPAPAAPVQVEAPQTVAPAPAPAPAAQTATPGATFETPAPVQEEVSDPGAETAEEDEAADAWPLYTAGGIGALLAAGILTVLGKRRLAARKRRSPGERPEAVPAPVESLELALRTVEEPADITAMDAAFRMLGRWAAETGTPLPRLFCTTIGDQGVVAYLMEPAELPAPFVKAEPNGTVWTIDRALIPVQDDVDTPAPYPGLVSVGRSADKNLLLELENLGSLCLSGDEETTREVMAAMANDLACSTWGEQLSITLVGVDGELAAELGPDRVKTIDNLDELIEQLQARAKETRAALDSLGITDLHTARTATDEGWAPEIVLLGQTPSEDQRAALAELVAAIPRLGIAAVSTDQVAGDWAIELTAGTALLQPLGLEFTPQKVTADEAAMVLASLRAAEAPPVQTEQLSYELEPEELPPAAPHLVAVPDLHQEAPEPAHEADEAPAEAAPTEVDEAEPAVAETAGSPAEETAATDEATDTADAGTEPVEVETLPETAMEAIARIADGRVVEDPAPMILLLGDMRILDHAGEAPLQQGTTRVAPAQVERCTAFAAFMALNPGATTEAFHEAFWPGTEPAKGRHNRSKLSNLTRKFLGHKADGTQWFPQTGAEGYKLDPQIRTDWSIFCELAGTDLSATSMDHLAAALRLVRGQPISGVKDKNVAWAEIIREDMRAKICDVAHELAVRALRNGNPALARWAGTVSRTVDPVNEQAWRDSMMAEYAAGNSAGVEELIAGLNTFLETLDEDFEPEDTTLELIDKLRHATAS
jgi:DNA-binding SARP family transcriptional activator